MSLHGFRYPLVHPYPLHAQRTARLNRVIKLLLGDLSAGAIMTTPLRNSSSNCPVSGLSRSVRPQFQRYIQTSEPCVSLSAPMSVGSIFTIHPALRDILYSLTS